MIQEQIKIKNKLGIHARPATLLAQEAGKYKSEIFKIAELCGAKIIDVNDKTPEQIVDLILDINISDDNKELSGEYWTDRKSVGSMKLVKV